MKKSILTAIVYIIIFAMEILAYYMFQADVIFIYGLMSLVAFVFIFAAILILQYEEEYLKV